MISFYGFDMKVSALFPFLSIALMICSCNTHSREQEKEGYVHESPKADVSKAKTPTVLIYAYGDFPKSVTSDLQGGLAKVFDNVEIKGHLEFPDDAWYAPRQRYRAPKLLDYQETLFTCKVQERAKKQYVLGLTSKDISLKYKEHEDWGVMGLSYCGRGVSVISSFRLGGIHKMNKESFCKLALHELGHAAGLPHCIKSKSCIMRDAKGKDHFPQLTDFCPSCRSFLQERGWNVQQ